MRVGEVKIADDGDFRELKRLCRCHDGWDQVYNKNSVTVWMKSNELSDFKMIKVINLLYMFIKIGCKLGRLKLYYN